MRARVDSKADSFPSDARRQYIIFTIVILPFDSFISADQGPLLLQRGSLASKKEIWKGKTRDEGQGKDFLRGTRASGRRTRDCSCCRRRRLQLACRCVQVTCPSLSFCSLVKEGNRPPSLRLLLSLGGFCCCSIAREGQWLLVSLSLTFKRTAKLLLPLKSPSLFPLVPK